MNDVNQLLSLPYGTLLALGLGYIGYRVAFIGHDGPHGTADIVFTSLVFAAIAKLVLLTAPAHPLLMTLPAIGAVIAAAVFWRTIGAPKTLKYTRKWRISDHDRGRNVWESMLMRQDLPGVYQIRVKLKDGREVMCDDTTPFFEKPLGANLFGPDGSVALYVTRSRTAGQDWHVETATDAGKLGAEMTFIPASEISWVKIRRN